MGKTKVIAIEGIDGSGKSVQYNKLAEALTDMGYSVEKREYPKYESYFGSHVGSYLSGAEGVKADTVDGKSMKAQPFSFGTIPAGSYKLVIFKPGKYVPKIVPITVESTALNLGQLKLWLYGDVNYDGAIKAIDVTMAR